MTTWQYRVDGIGQLGSVISQLRLLMETYHHYVCIGELGAGKTTLVKEWLKKDGVDDAITSPTFSVINEYRSPSRTYFHMDLYRLKGVDELYEIGIEEYLDQEAICIIEWPDLVIDLLEKAYIQINIENNEGIRDIVITVIEV